MRDVADLQRRALELRQHLLLAVKQALNARLDGSDDEGDLALLMQAAEEVRHARDGLEQLCKRLKFYIELEQVRSGRASDDGSRTLIALTRLGVEGGYAVGEVRQLIERALGRAPRS
ncbi:MAG: hypothetical protein N3B15_09805 [Planctomycetota bacterium]|nr:hypothetical protein [Planctomycetota bacterium]